VPQFSAPHQLEYSPPPKWHQRWRTRRWVVVLAILVLIGMGFWQRVRLMNLWSVSQLAWAQWRCLNHSDDATTIAYTDDPVLTKQLAGDDRYLALPNAAVALKCSQWEALKTKLGRGTFLWPQRHVGGTVFLHERFTPSGKRLLVHAMYGPVPGSAQGYQLSIFLLDMTSLSLPASFCGGLGCDDGSFFTGTPTMPDPSPVQRNLHVFCGQPDPADRTQFSIDFELNGQRNRASFRILDPDPASNVPDWARVERVIPGDP
jgi:hypothetical protein